ncbi:MAG: GDP-mannose 4,6-dehydratase [Aliidongia sp.]
MWRMLQHDQPDDYVIATGETRPLSDLVAAVFAQLDLDWRDHVDTDETLFRPTEMQRVELNPSRARERLGWVARSRMEDVVAHLVACAQEETLGPVPWAPGNCRITARRTWRTLSETMLRRASLRAVV